MATYRKRGAAWRAEVTKGGIRRSATFDTKSQAQAWATQLEADINAGKHSHVSVAKTLADALDRYKEEVAAKRRGARWEVIRIDRFRRELSFVGDRIDSITDRQISAWRDSRLKEVAPSSVNRELNLLSAVFEAARRDWRWTNINPTRGIRRPKDPRPRDRRVSVEETAAMMEALGYRGGPPETVSNRVALAFLFALETAMRASEITGLEWGRVFTDQRFIKLDITKNDDARNVPLSSEAIRLLALLPRGDGPCFGVSSASLDSLWRKARVRAQVTTPAVADLHFHDSRHEAITRLARKLDVLDLARMIGHRDPKSLMIYYNATASDIAGRLG